MNIFTVFSFGLALLLKCPSAESRRYQTSNDVFDDLFDDSTMKKIYSVYNLVRRLATPLVSDLGVGQRPTEDREDQYRPIKGKERPSEHPRLDVERGDTTLLDVKVAPNLDRVHNYLKSKDVYIKVKEMVGKAAAFVKGFQSATDVLVGNIIDEDKDKRGRNREIISKRQGTLNEDEVLVKDTEKEERQRTYKRKHRRHHTEPEPEGRKSYAESFF